jgi:hypothetical protein
VSTEFFGSDIHALLETSESEAIVVDDAAHDLMMCRDA